MIYVTAKRIMIGAILLAIASGVVLVAYSTQYNNRQKAMSSRDQQRKTDLKNLRLALYLFDNENLVYPEPTADYQINNNILPEQYLEAIPTDPSDGNLYGYESKNEGKAFRIWAPAENSRDKDAASGYFYICAGNWDQNNPDWSSTCTKSLE